LSKSILTVQAMAFQPFCIGQNSTNSEQISAGKDVLPYGNKWIYIYLCTVNPVFKVKDTLVKSVLHLILHHMPFCCVVLCIGIFQSQLYICNEYWNGKEKNTCS
jgi:hypothetical protein